VGRQRRGGIALGPIACGWLLEQFWWGAIFVFMAPVAAVLAALVAWKVPTSRDLPRSSGQCPVRCTVEG